MARRQHLTLTLMAVMLFLSLTYVLSTRSSGSNYSPMSVHDDILGNTEPGRSSSGSGNNLDSDLSDRILKGGSIAPKLENATAKAELGRASWKLFHTMMGRFPDKPTADDSLALKTYVHLFARLYPCGDCAAHFQKLLRKYPPQVSSRNAAAGWACLLHNEVNKRLKKPQFDCNNIGDFYDCGCGDDEKGGKNKGEDLKGREGVTLEKEEGLIRGG
ncbi:hypothetical protein C8A00DRAFT_18747 [Chaetomidium leptoderma]|uniref:Sulfhydryl oxidase n=1 Tax=Chaetomidium leptoderma TaxID=669021 RepID=A0AAN6ZTK4_9PEZI|nr:hypothetical protein C8A00DRAFT_18747 [Chaetomidium leptoderma]